MKTLTKTAVGMIIAASGAYGAWALYKKYGSSYMSDMNHMFKDISKDVEKDLDNVM